MPDSNVINGLICFNEPHKVNFVDFGYKHLDCDSIVTKESVMSGRAEVGVVCYSSSKEYNDRLRELFNKQYKGKGYCLMQRISSAEANSID